MDQPFDSSPNSESTIEETIQRSDLSAFHYVWHWRVVVLGVCGLVGIPFIAMLYQGHADISIVAAGLAAVALFSVCFLFLQGFIGKLVVRRQLPRTVRIRHGGSILEISTRRESESHALRDCVWRFSRAREDLVCQLTRLRRGIVIYTPTGCVVVGHDATQMERWQSILQASKVPYCPAPGCLRLFVLMVFGVGAGGAIGHGIGCVINIWFFDEYLRWALTLLGIPLGLFATLGLATSGRESPQAALDRLQPGAGLTLAVLGLVIGILGGLPVALVCAFLTALGGELIIWTIRRKIRRYIDSRGSAPPAGPTRG